MSTKLGYLIIILTCVNVVCAKSSKKENGEDAKKPDTTYSFKSVEIVGYQDNPTPFYIMDADGGQTSIVDLERSFMNALRRNVDKEQIHRH